MRKLIRLKFVTKFTWKARNAFVNISKCKCTCTTVLSSDVNVMLRLFVNMTTDHHKITERLFKVE